MIETTLKPLGAQLQVAFLALHLLQNFVLRRADQLPFLHTGEEALLDGAGGELPQVPVLSIRLVHQLGVRTYFTYLAFFIYVDDLVAAHDRAQPMSNDQHRLLFAVQDVDRIIQRYLRLDVQRSSGLVEEQNPRVS